MNTNILSSIKNAKSLQNNIIGIEREGLRTKQSGCIATSPHPVNFGSALTNSIITTDFSESLIEVVTPPLNSVKKTLNFLEDTLHFVHKNLENNENFWPASMPCIIRGQTEINIAKYGKSNAAKMKEIYRKGLANRYGSAMQVVAGIHFNYSFSDDFWQNYQKITGNLSIPLREFKDEQYMSLIRNVLRYGWVLYYLFGASNTVCKSFLRNYHKHNLINFNENTLYQPYATSLRMGDIGYQNTREDEAGVKANYNSVIQYAHSLQDAMQTNFCEYTQIGLKKEGKYQQLNTNILQIENEYYSSVRPKPSFEAGIMPSISLINNGIEYIELRGIDINPLNPLGITEEQILFLESFLLFCLTADSKPITSREQVAIDNNNIKVAHYGVDKNLLLTKDDNEVYLKSWLEEIITEVKINSKVFSDKHFKAVTSISKNKLPSQIILDDMRDKNYGFSEWTNMMANKHNNYFMNKGVNNQHFEMLKKETQTSINKLKQIEQADNISFPQYLNNYFSQL